MHLVIMLVPPQTAFCPGSSYLLVFHAHPLDMYGQEHDLFAGNCPTVFILNIAGNLLAAFIFLRIFILHHPGKLDLIILQ
mgnify:CR=1 FL=1